MSSLRTRTVLSSLRTYFEKNRKVIICAIVLFVIGIILGIILTYRAVDGSFERVPRVDVETGAARVFFFAVLGLFGCYGLLLISGISNKTVFIAIIPFTLLGFLCGRYSFALIGRYEGFGVFNLIIIYLPFFLITFVCMVLAAANILSSSCTDCSGHTGLRQSFVCALKIFGINAACALVLFLIIGSISGVIIVTLF